MKFCTKCGKEAEDGVIFCPGCGTKHYLPVWDKEHRGALLTQIPKCKLVMLGVLPVECTLCVWDNHMTVVGSNGKNLLDLPLTAIASLDVSKQTLIVKNMKEKSYQITLPPQEADFIFYVQDLILDYRKGCIDTGSFAGVSELGESTEKLAGMGIALWMKERPVAEQDGTKARVFAEKMYVAKSGRPFRFAGQLYQNFQQLCARTKDDSYLDIYGRIGTWRAERFPIFDTADSLHENRYWRYFYMKDKEILHLVVFRDEKDENDHWKSENGNVEIEIFENVEKGDEKKYP